MLKKQISQYLEKLLAENQGKSSIELYKEEKEYIDKHQLFADGNVTIIEKEPPFSRFDDVYIERCDKESEELIAVEKANFLEQPIHYFKNHLNEFIYVESEWFDLIDVDAISFEIDSVFGTFDVMLGLKVQKKWGGIIKSYFTTELINEAPVFDLMFNQNDGVWDINFSLNDLEGFHEEWTLMEAFSYIYTFLFHLAEEIENV